MKDDTWQLTPKLRWIRRSTQTESNKWILQQGWVSNESGSIEWEDVPTEEE